MPRPSMLVFLSDDHGQWASSPYGNREIQSPTLQWLADTGVTLEAAHCVSPVCSPARASFFTGHIPSRHGLHDWLQEAGPPSPGVGPLPDLDEQLLLPGRLRAAGYRTGLCGKWHCGSPERRHPDFDDWFSSLKGTRAVFGTQAFLDNDTVVEWHGHQAPRITERAVRFLRETPSEQPFFLFVGYTNTHTPHHAEAPRHHARYRTATFADIPDEDYAPCHGFARKRPAADPALRRRDLVDYYAAVSAIDEEVGRVLDELQGLGRLDNTIVVYTSDHGHMNGHHGLHCKGQATIPQNFLEESVLVPALLRWPGRLPAGARFGGLCSHLDLHATLLDAAGLPAAHTPGSSLLPALAEGDSRGRDHVCAEYGNARMIRDHRHKLIVRGPGPNGHFPDELYDLAADPRETVNLLAGGDLAPEHRAAEARLRAELTAFFAAHADARHDGFDVRHFPRHNPVSPWDEPLVERPEHAY